MAETHYIRTADNVILRFVSIEVIKEWLSEGKLRWDDFYLVAGKDWVTLKDYLGSSQKETKSPKTITAKLSMISAIEKIETSASSQPVVLKQSVVPVGPVKEKKESPPWADSEPTEVIPTAQDASMKEEKIPWKESDLRLPPVGRRSSTKSNENKEEKWVEEIDYEKELLSKSSRPLKIFGIFILIIILGAGAFWGTLQILESTTGKKSSIFLDQDAYIGKFVSKIKESHQDIIVKTTVKDFSIYDKKDIVVANKTEIQQEIVKNEKLASSKKSEELKKPEDTKEVKEIKTLKDTKKTESKTQEGEEKAGSFEGKAGSYEALIQQGKDIISSDPAKAISYFMSASKKKPNLAEPLSLIGECYSRMGDPKQSVTYYSKSLINNKDHLPSIIGLARAYKRLGLSGQAKIKYQEYLKLSPDGKHAEEARENIK